MTYRNPSLAEVAVEVAVAWPKVMRLRHCGWHFDASSCSRRAPAEERAALGVHIAGIVGDRRYDALLAAIAEYLCARSGMLAPAWVEDEYRFLEQWWFVSGIKSLHADAIANSPISFSRRGVFITAGALTYA